MRHYIGISSKGVAVRRNVRRDPTGQPLLLVDEGEIVRLVVNFSAYLEAGETVSSATATGTGVTVTPTTSSPNVTLAISSVGTDGEIALLVTMSTGDVYALTIYVRTPVRVGDESTVLSDYE